MEAQTKLLPEKSKNQGGRPLKLHPDEDTLKQIKSLAHIHCTQNEAAAVLGVHRQTFGEFLDSSEKARAAWENGRESGKASLRRLQFKNADNGHVAMQIWLGKQYLGQADKSESDNTVRVSGLDALLEEIDGAGRAIVGVNGAVRKDPL